MIAHSSELPSAAVTSATGLSVIRISGPDRVNFLQGQLSNDIAQLTPQQAMRACHCDAKGKMWSSLLLLQWQQEIFALMEESALDAALAELKKYAVFSKIEFEHPVEGLSLYGVVGDAPLAEHQLSPAQDKLSCTSDNDHLQVRLEGDAPRYLVLSRHPLNWTAPSLSSAEWQLTEIQQGVSHISAATQSEFVPQQINMQALGAISFSKGCYMGQETVARTKYLGKNKRAAFVLMSAQPVRLGPGDALEVQMGEHWRRGGTVLNCATLGNETWLIAVLPNDTEANAVLRSQEHPQAQFKVQPLPYSLDDQ